jgi:hypothetical protein
MNCSAVPSRALQTCRLEGAGFDLYGREDVAGVLADFALDQAEVWLETDRARILVIQSGMVWLEYSDHGVSRAWIVREGGIEVGPRPRIDIPADPDMAQANGGLRFDAADHPGLTGDGAAMIAGHAGRWPDLAMQRVRPLVLRAMSDAARTAALVMIEGEVGRLQIPRQCWAILLIEGETVIRKHDQAGLDQDARRLWTPRF